MVLSPTNPGRNCCTRSTPSEASISSYELNLRTSRTRTSMVLPVGFSYTHIQLGSHNPGGKGGSITWELNQSIG